MNNERTSTDRVPGLSDEARRPGIVEVFGRFRPTARGAGTFGGWGPKLG
ncbi:MAG: hypothetical protein IAI50_15985 [Candidatus Eremiobacteraeota bacterium]|nr:hypothetical protein [Candidatus Eremiobacteraeota bacterium]